MLRALADLAPAGADRILDVTRGGRALAWLPRPDVAPRGKAFDRLAALDALHREERLLRRGWGLVVGSMPVDGKLQRVRLPLLTEPVRLQRGLRGYHVLPAGELEVTPLIRNRTLAADLANGPLVGTPPWLTAVGTTAWMRAVAEAAGLPVADVRPAGEIPRKLPADDLVLFPAAALYLSRDVFSAGLRDALISWAARPGLDRTALAHVYGDTQAPVPPSADEDVLSPLPLNPAQREVVRAARERPLTVVSGPPGCGKSHAVVAAAIEVVDRGGSVLIATQSSHAADVLGDLLRRYPGPTPVLFGDAERRAAIATELGAGAPAGTPDRVLRADRDAVERARSRVRGLESAIEAALATEALAAELPQWEPLLPGLAVDVPGAFTPDAGLDPARNRWSRWWQRRRLGVAGAVPDDRVTAALEAARCIRAAARLASTGGTDLTATWTALVAADEALAEAAGQAVRRRATSAARWSREARRAAGGLATALRAGRDRRRELLATLPGPALVRALPLWIGTVTDVEDLLPPTPGLFDLVILDEASHVDQIRAAAVLARARRALIVGDPRQLRFVSFVADVDVTGTLRRHGLDDRVDVRRVSAFDLAAGAAPVTWLAEHYRGDPHLIEFSAQRFYAGRITLATRHPRNEDADAIDVVRVADPAAEVTAAVEVVRDLVGKGESGIAVLTPFRAQAEAVEAALLAAFDLPEIERLGLRTGTVHAFQGSEAGTVVASLGLAGDDPAGRHRFVADPNLFNVLVTRARRRMIVVTALGPQTGGLVGEYLAHSARRPAPPAGGTGSGDRTWPGRLAAELARAGVPVRRDYPVGDWHVDLCAGEAGPATAGHIRNAGRVSGGRAGVGPGGFAAAQIENTVSAPGESAGVAGLICAVHPDGPAAHIRRERALRRAGWRLLDAFPSRWSDNPAAAALELSRQVLAQQESES
ncbi:hypothetical protein Ari01nite_17350 [Paractinoplanes rishiriensis]|uniref:DNA2/NAM7 helicase-like C-terminal domain-containing protein n=1 Tax=Paractinoplanes rishiriensis TaxID=1050105 RepID=A0A919JVA7_9ACTN|nr:hypothetical protein Ari01nite_17350 [Actinoplanes rishiriensis]